MSSSPPSSVGPSGASSGSTSPPSSSPRPAASPSEAGYSQVDFREGRIEQLPAETASFDCVISNGVINLAPDKDAVFAEAARVLRPGGRLAIADIVSEQQMKESIVCDADLWASCIGGAAQMDAYREAIEGSGLRIEQIRDNPYEFISDRARNASDKYGVKSVSLACQQSQPANLRRGTMTATTNPNKALWEKGDFTQIAETMRESGEELVGKLGITEGMRVLDLGCGDGTTAVPAAQLGAEVLGVDIATNLVAAGNARAEELGLTNLSFQEGDASNLNELDDGAFDLVISIFGAMFAPKPFDVAKEMVRVTKPGGRIVMGNWIPNDPTLVAQILKISAVLLSPAPGGLRQPGDLGRGGERGRAVHRTPESPRRRISCERDTYTFNSPGSPSELVAEFRAYYGPTMNAFEAAEADGREDDLQTELEKLFNEQNTSDDGTSIPATFLRVTVER